MRTDAPLLFPGLLLVLVAGVFVFPADAYKREASSSPEEQASRLRGLWKIHMKESKQKSKASSPPIGSGLKQQLLYCRVGIGYHLQILPDGSVGGVHKPTEHCWLRVFTMKNGVVGIKGVKSGLYLCMRGTGAVYGSEQFSDECLFKENLEENLYTTYSSLSRPGNYLALSQRGLVKRGNKAGRHQSCTHFLPRWTS
ncbi:fibroblast growth factor 4A-like [Genypterus blacodes]|uniref:fibroblast growth factor 4A-like n=1 Tax=Genypterus blacodes TaxID=154954 RepID=UPI003F7769CF